jgi:hypothetical protein
VRCLHSNCLLNPVRVLLLARITWLEHLDCAGYGWGRKRLRRRPMPTKPNSSLFDRLPDETVCRIIAFVGMSFVPYIEPDRDDSIDESDAVHPWILRLTYCSKRLRRLALPQLYHTLSLSDMYIMHRLLERMIETPIYRSFVKTLLLKWGGEYEDYG